jgi:hypothetical protein
LLPIRRPIWEHRSRLACARHNLAFVSTFKVHDENGDAARHLARLGDGLALR